MKDKIRPIAKPNHVVTTENGQPPNPTFCRLVWNNTFEYPSLDEKKLFICFAITCTLLPKNKLRPVTSLKE